MIRKSAIVIGLCALSCLVSILPVTAASSFTFTLFDVPFPNAVDTAGGSINDIGQIVGGYTDSISGEDHGFLRDAQGNYSKIDFPGASAGTNALAINNRGEIVGRFFFPPVSGIPNPADGFLLSRGVYSQIDVNFLNSFDTKARGINDAGTIVGTYRDSTRMPLSGQHTRGFLLSAGLFSPIDFPGAPFTRVVKINDLGQIVGAYLDSSSHTHGFLLSGGAFSTIDVPSASQTFLTGINNTGEITGLATDGAGTVHSFLESQGSFMEIVIPGVMGNCGGASLIDCGPGQPGVGGINDLSQITGTFMTVDGHFHGFIGTPTGQQ